MMTSRNRLERHERNDVNWCERNRIETLKTRILLHYRTSLYSFVEMIFLILVFWMQLATAIAVDVSFDDPCSGNEILFSSRYDPLACWLWKLQLSIPNQSFHKTFFSLGIEDMTCTNFTMSSIVSSYLPSNHNKSSSSSSTSNNNDPSLDITVLGVAATCQGRYKATPGLGGTVQVHVDSDAITLGQQQQPEREMSVSSTNPPLHLIWSFVSHVSASDNNNNTNDTTTTLSSSSFQWPVSLNTTFCDTHLMVPSHGGIHFSGSISAQMINWFSGSIAKYVSDALSTQLCPLMIANIDPTLSHLLQQAQVYLQHLIDHPNTNNTTNQNTTNHNNDNNHTEEMREEILIPTQQRLEQVDGSTVTRPKNKTSHHTTNATNSSVWLNFTADTPVLTSALTLLNDMLLKQYLHEGLLLHWWNQNLPSSCHRNDSSSSASSCGWLFGGMNSLAKSFFSLLAKKKSHQQQQLEDALCFRIPPDKAGHKKWFSPLHNLTFVVPRYGKVSLDVKQFCIQGLDQMDDVQFFRPRLTPEFLSNNKSTNTTPTTTSFEINLFSRRGWNITTQLHVTVQSIPGGIIQGPDLEEEFRLHANISQGHIGTATSVPGNDTTANHSNTASGLVFRVRRDLFQQFITVGMLEDALGSILSSLFGNWSLNSNTKQQLWPCFLAPLESMYFPFLVANLTMESISFVPVDNNDNVTKVQQRKRVAHDSNWIGGANLEEDVDELLNHVLQLFLNEYPDTFIAAIAGLTSGPLRFAVNRWLDKSLYHWKKPTLQGDQQQPSSAEAVLAVCNGTMTNSSAAVPSTLFAHFDEKRLSSTSLKHLVNWTHVHILESVNRWLQRNHTIDGINQYLNCVSSFISNNLLPTIDIGFDSFFGKPDPSVRTPSDGLTFRVRHAQLANTGRLDHIEAMSPVSHMDGLLESRLDYGTCSNESAHGVETLPQLYAELELLYPAFANLSAKINLTVYLGDVHLNGTVSVLYDQDLLRGMMLSDVLMKGHCALSVPSSKFQIPETMARIGLLGMNVSALVTTIDTSADDPVRINLHYQDLPSVAVSSIVNWAFLSVRDWVNELSDSVLSASQKVCNSTQEALPDPPEDDNNHTTAQWIHLGVGVLFVLVQPAILMLVKNRRPAEPAQNDSSDRELLEPLLSPLEELVETKMHALEDSVEIVEKSPSSLMMSHAVPDMIRVLLPMFVIGTIAMLLSSNLSVGASVNVFLTSSGQSAKEVKLPSLFAFSLGNTIRQMYQARIYPLLFLVLVFSGVWPYLKLVLLLLGWMVSIPKRVTFQRKQLLLALDALGKFSLVDTYVLVLMMVAFRYHLQLTEKMAVDVFVTPSYGFYGFLIATCASLVAGHAMIFFHRRDELNAPPSSLLENPSAVEEHCEAVMQHAFYVHNISNDGTRLIKRKKLRWWVRVLFFVTGIATIILLKVGVTRKSFVFEFGGLAGMALDDDKRRMSYSLVSLGAALPSSVPTDYGAGIRWLQLAYYFYALVTPFACLTLVLVLWAFPLSLHHQLWVVTIAEITNAWSAIEVFVLSVVAALLEISTFCSFIIGNKCDWINEFVSKYLDKALANHHDDHTCYSVQAHVQWDCWYLIVGAILNSLLVSTILRFAHAALDDRRLLQVEANVNAQHHHQVRDANNEELRLTEHLHDEATMIGCLSRGSWSQWLFYIVEDDAVVNDVAEPTQEAVIDGKSQQYWQRWREVCSVT